MAGSSAGTFPLSSDGTYDVGNMKVEEYLDIQEEAVHVKTEMVMGSEEEQCLDIKEEDGIHSEEEEEEGIDTKKEEEENVEVKEEVSFQETL
jgi:hypothetical protein